MPNSLKTTFAAALSSLFLTVPFPVWAQGPSLKAMQCASLLVGTEIPPSQRLISALHWPGPRAAGRNFFFEKDGLAQANQVLKSSRSADEVKLWGALIGAGFNSLVTIRSSDGKKILAQGRLVPSEAKPDFAGDTIVVKQVGIFTDNGIVYFSTAEISNPTQISIAKVPFEIPTSLRSLKSNSDFATSIGIPFLERFVSIANLVKNLKSGRLTPVGPTDRPGTTWNEAVYLSIGKDTNTSYFESFKEQGLPIDQEPIFLVFSNELLNRQDFWINEGWDLGQFTRSSIYVNNSNFRKALYLHARFAIWGRFRPEVVFAEEIPLSTLQSIYVRPGSKVRILEHLRTQLSPAQISGADSLILEHE